jgi:hypothetical protein
MKFWLPLLIGIALLGYAVFAAPGCAELTDRPPSWGPPVPCSQDPSCLPPPNDWGDNPSTMLKKPDGGTK